MHILFFIHRLLKPGLTGDIHIFFLIRHWFRHHEASVIIIKSNASQFIFICLIQQIQFDLDIRILPGKITFFNGIIVRRVGNLAHADQIIFQTLSSLFDEFLCILNILFPGHEKKLIVHDKSHGKHDKNGYQGKCRHNCRLNLLGLHKIPESDSFTFHFLYAPFCIWTGTPQTAV